MKSLKNNLPFLFLIPALMFMSACVPSSGPAQDLIFFYFETCPSCDQYVMAQDYSEMLTRLNKDKKWNARSHNLITPEAAEQLKITIQEKGLPDISRSLPLLIIGNEYINGYEAIGEKLKELSTERP